MTRRIIKSMGWACLTVLFCILCMKGSLAADMTAEQSEEQLSGEEEEPEEEEPEEEEPEEEPEKPVIRFETEFPLPDGKNGYYVSRPYITIIHPGKYGITKFRLKHEENICAEGEIKEEGSRIKIDSEKFYEGENILAVWMEDEQGKRIEGYEMVKIFRIDMTPPVISLSTEKGFDYWYSGPVDLQVDVKDQETGSQPESVVCMTDGRKIGESREKACAFRIETPSRNGKGVPVTVRAWDRAGNMAETTEILFIDVQAPEVSVDGLSDCRISSIPIEIQCAIMEENKIRQAEARIEWESPEGRLVRSTLKEWEKMAEGMQLSRRLSEDGIYRIVVNAEDAAGHTVLSEGHVVIDRQNPRIQYVDQLNGQYLKYFYWNYHTEELVEDNTSVIYTIHMDGDLYTMGTMIDREGKHVLEVHAVDAAGNKGTARAEFVIDHTPPRILFEHVEEGRVYEEMCEFRIRLADDQDKITAIQINGVEQPLTEIQGVYSYTVQEAQNYEVEVEACDVAGNQTDARLRFQVVPKETLAEKMFRPLVRTLGIASEKGDSEDGNEDDLKNNKTEEKKSDMRWKWITVGIAVPAGVFIVRLISKKKKFIRK